MRSFSPPNGPCPVGFPDWLLGASLAALTVLLLEGCSALPRQAAPRPTATIASNALPFVIYVIRERWHTAVGFSAADLRPPLAALERALPRERYLLFGFGDRHYLLGRSPQSSELLSALWPGQGVMMLNGLRLSPEAAYGQSNVVRLALSGAQIAAVESFIGSSFAPGSAGASSAGPSGAPVAPPLRPGPFPESLYYDSTLRYSALYTCNTWTADVLRAAGLPVHATGVVFAHQIWAQVRRLARRRGSSAGLGAHLRPSG